MPLAFLEQITETVLSKARVAFSGACAFTFHLIDIGGFPGATYLRPEPSEPFIALTKGLVHQFPEHLPYGGQYNAIVPHLTVAQGEYERDLIETQLASRLPVGGIEASCKEVVLLENSSGLWRHMHSFPLAALPSKAANPFVQQTGRERPAAE